MATLATMSYHKLKWPLVVAPCVVASLDDLMCVAYAPMELLLRAGMSLETVESWWDNADHNLHDELKTAILLRGEGMVVSLGYVVVWAFIPSGKMDKPEQAGAGRLVVQHYIPVDAAREENKLTRKQHGHNGPWSRLKDSYTSWISER